MHREIVLSGQQMREAAEVARRLHGAVKSAGGKNAHGLNGDTQFIEIDGCQAEYACSLALGVAWTGRQGGRGADVGTRTQVRSSSKPRPSHCLIVRPSDVVRYGNVPFVLVIQSGDRFSLRGWMMSHDAAQPKWLTRKGTCRPEAWFVPEADLRPIDELTSP